MSKREKKGNTHTIDEIVIIFMKAHWRNSSIRRGNENIKRRMEEEWRRKKSSTGDEIIVNFSRSNVVYFSNSGVCSRFDASCRLRNEWKLMKLWSYIQTRRRGVCMCSSTFSLSLFLFITRTHLSYPKRNEYLSITSREHDEILLKNYLLPSHDIIWTHQLIPRHFLLISLWEQHNKNEAFFCCEKKRCRWNVFA